MVPSGEGIRQLIEASRDMTGPDRHHVFGAPGHQLPEESVHLARSGAPLFVDVRHHGSVVCGYHHFPVGVLVPEVLEGEENCLELEQVYV